MEPRVSLLTLGVSDLQRVVAFYRDGLGWPKSEIGGEEEAFFKTGGVVIALFPRTSFASDAGVDLDNVEHGGFSRVSLAHNVAEENQVDSVLTAVLTRVDPEANSRRGRTSPPCCLS